MAAKGKKAEPDIDWLLEALPPGLRSRARFVMRAEIEISDATREGREPNLSPTSEAEGMLIDLMRITYEK